MRSRFRLKSAAIVKFGLSGSWMMGSGDTVVVQPVAVAAPSAAAWKRRSSSWQ